ncbi:MAG: ribonuclease HI family protein [Anaerolineales bacterium]
MVDVVIVFDGGSRGNPGPAYGSFRLQVGDQDPFEPVRLVFGLGTNNEAEYKALLAAIQDLLEHLKLTKIKPQDVRLMVKGDSRLVIEQISGGWKAKDERMRNLRDEILGLLGQFGRVEVKHHDRSESVRILGH